jgi:hypothetical protein
MHASNIQVVHLQGALGFGTCRQITDLVEDLAGGQGVAPTFGEEEESTLGRSKFVMVGPAKLARPLYIVVCLRNVTSLDYSAAQQLVKMKNAAVKSHQGSQGKHETVAHHIIYTRYRPEVKRTLMHCGCVNEGDEIVGDVAPGDLPCVALCESYMRVLICSCILPHSAGSSRRSFQFCQITCRARRGRVSVTATWRGSEISTRGSRRSTPSRLFALRAVIRLRSSVPKPTPSARAS